MGFNLFSVRRIGALILLFGLFLSPAHALDPYYAIQGQGWFWYHDPDRLPKAKEEKPSEAPIPLSPTERFKAFQKRLETSLHRAILDPTLENVAAYQYLQKKMVEQAERFSNRWASNVLLHPALDTTSTFPTSQMGQRLYKTQKSAAMQQNIQAAAQEYGLFFFFQSNCAYCDAMAPIVKRFATHYRWSLLPISLDGGAISDFPDATPDTKGWAARLHVEHTPALFAVHPHTGKILPIARGMVTEDELERRVHQLLQFTGETS